MTIQVTINVADAATTGKECGVIEVTEHGLGSRYMIKPGCHSGLESIYQHRALLLVEGYYDAQDGTPDDERENFSNPLDEFLRREHPTVPLQQELRKRLSYAESEAERLRMENQELKGRIAAIESAMRR